MTKTLTLFAALAAALVIGIAPAGAITDGALDGEGHPYVGLMVAQDKKGNPLWRCSGTLISPKVFLTAGHCTEAPAARAQIWFLSDVQATLATNGYPNRGEVAGKTYTHPEYNPNAFFIRDLGVVVLDRAVSKSTYGKLPAQDSLDKLKPGSSTVFTAVGYGLQKSFPDAASWKEQASRTRYYANPHLIQINGGLVGDFSLLLSNNANTGGTCFGDSGGPNFYPANSTTVAGVTSFGLNGNCAGTGGVFRVDRSWSLNWLYTSFGTLL
jgi:secreted trypsin-like serine protease